MSSHSDRTDISDSTSGIYLESTKEEQFGALEGETEVVGRVMLRQPAVLTPDATLADAAEVLKFRRVPVIALCDHAGVTGFVTEGDIAVNGTTEPGMRLGKIMQKVTAFCFEQDTLATAVRLMTRHRVQWLPVLDSMHSVIGMVSAEHIAGFVSPRTAQFLLRTIASRP